MKIIKAKKVMEGVAKDDTQCGEVYTLIDADTVHFRCQGGFANLGGGGFTQYEHCREDACWVHQPNAEIHLNN